MQATWLSCTALEKANQGTWISGRTIPGEWQSCALVEEEEGSTSAHQARCALNHPTVARDVTDCARGFLFLCVLANYINSLNFFDLVPAA